MHCLKTYRSISNMASVPRERGRRWLLRPRHGLPPDFISPETENSEILCLKYQALGPRVHSASTRVSNVLAGTLNYVSNNIHTNIDTVTSYISFCQDLCIPQKTVKVFGNDKPWFTRNLKIKLKQKDEAFKSGDRALYKKAKCSFEKAIREAKTDYRRKLEGQFLSNDTRSVWPGLQCIAAYKQKHSIRGSDSATPDNFNNFYARFDRQNLTPIPVSLPDPAVPLPPPFTVQEHEVKKLLK